MLSVLKLIKRFERTFAISIVVKKPQPQFVVADFEQLAMSFL